MHKRSSDHSATVGGFVKLPRNIQDSGIVDDPYHFSIWVWLLILAAYKRHYVRFNDTRIELQPGQLVTSLRILSRKSGIGKNRCATILHNLKEENFIRHRSTNKYTLITVLNWERDQSAVTQKGHRRDRREEGIRNYKSYESAIHSDEFLLDMDSKNYGQK